MCKSYSDDRKRPLTGFEPAPLSLQVKCAVRYTTEVVLTMRVRSRSRYSPLCVYILFMAGKF